VRKPRFSANGEVVMLDVNNLMVFFENALALNDFSMQVREGEITAPARPR
jgi:ABC-type branched-subunit amino acid transport system ATPase component